MFYVRTNPYFNLQNYEDFNMFSKEMKVNIIEEEDHYEVLADVAGVKKENIKIDVFDDTLTIDINESKEQKEKEEKYLLKERCYRKVKRSFYLPNIDEEGIKAKYDNGILSININKKVNKNKNKNITIE